MPDFLGLSKIKVVNWRSNILQFYNSEVTVMNEDKAIFTRYVEQVLNAKNLAAVDEFFATNRQLVRDTIIALHEALPDVFFTIDDLIGEGSKIALRWTAHGTPAGENRLESWSGVTLARFERHKIVEFWSYTGGSLLQANFIQKGANSG
jgi:predicted ester cyclase